MISVVDGGEPVCRRGHMPAISFDYASSMPYNFSA
jgi:hypothetical protein